MGCTACGKGSVGLELARRIGGRIVSVDSMKVYRRMDIGTAKPSARIRSEIPHYCIDIAEPSEEFSVARYVQFADSAIADARAGGAVPLAVGGTSLYIKALSEGLFEAPPPDRRVRADLRDRAQREGSRALHAELSRLDPDSAARIHPNDAKRIIRALEVHRTTGESISRLQSQWDSGARRYDCVFIGLRRDKADLHARINDRVRRMIESGLVDEVRSLLDDPRGLSVQAAQGLGYAEIIEYLQARCELDKSIERMKINTRRLAKKQRTWFRRFPDVRWFDLAGGDEPETTAERIAKEIEFE